LLGKALVRVPRGNAQRALLRTVTLPDDRKHITDMIPQRREGLIYCFILV